jgi:hypothetical protein
MFQSNGFHGLLAALILSVAGFAISPATAATCQSISFANGGFNGTGNPCPADTIFSNTPDPTTDSAPNLQDKSVNGSPLLGSFTGAGTFPGTGNIGDFTITSVGGLTGTWAYAADPGDIFPKWVEISSGSNWFLILLPNTLAGATSGNWSTCPSGLGGGLCLQNPPGNAAQALSHIAFFDGVEPPGGSPPAVPLPGALPLFVSGLGGLGLLGWRKRRKAKTATV